eukprot:scaffold372505_cov18-Prasinocladus_malaysianus.AAC.1
MSKLYGRHAAVFSSHENGTALGHLLENGDVFGAQWCADEAGSSESSAVDNAAGIGHRDGDEESFFSDKKKAAQSTCMLMTLMSSSQLEC